ncbi:ATP-dependent DNA helicase PIF1-like [Sorghum bicolor]|uniref:ATP-dependent DNA helicase PIF1-like n=1 Tax=Sorghum bicolor TaxID=4558 RepID=UPI000B4237DF|nr:ATP-dependent DNA helicase PIF1-like [Sorghum bicolor]|eukprot:XP_021303794.1 ATP-dependent DNA helicase PIF1-like [Sorghum bicolor]
MDGDHGLHNDNLYDDDGVIQQHAQGHHYESYRVLPKGPAENSVTDDDPYEFIYHNLPQRHKLRQVSDCSYCGGTGKSFLYKALLARVRSRGLIAIATATSGIAASILPGGRTAHSRFKIPIKIGDNIICSFTKQSGTAELLHRASLIIWDEVARTKRQCVETLDRSLQDIMECALPFGGKVMVFGGDIRQVLHVVTRGTRAQVTDATLQRSYLWDKIRKIRLSRNMRAQSDPWFSEYLLRIGNGTEETIGDDYVRLPDDIVIGYTNTEVAVNQLIQDVFPSLEEHATAYMSSRAILSTKNDHVDRLNAMMIERFPSDEKVYHSFDTVVDDPQNHFPIDFMNLITPNGLTPHELKLKINCPMILLRNLDPNNGLCNGTRLMVRALQDNAIDAEIVAGQHAWKRVFIPRLSLSPLDDISLPFKFKRKQFPVHLTVLGASVNKWKKSALPSNILDLTAIENKDADSAWFTPLKDVLSHEMMDMVAEAKDLAKESKTGDNYVREVNTDENNGGSDCTMISIPLQE